MRRALPTHINNKRRHAHTVMFKTKKKQNKNKNRNKINHGKLKDNKADVKLGVKIFGKYTFQRITVYK